MYKWGSYFLLENSVAIFLKLAENKNFNKIASLPVRGEDQNEKIFFPHLFPLPLLWDKELRAVAASKNFSWGGWGGEWGRI